LTIESPEIAFQNHVRNYLVREHGYRLLTAKLDHSTYSLAALMAFLEASQPDTLADLRADYGDDAPREIGKALEAEASRRPLWTILREHLAVRGRTFKLFYPIPRSPDPDGTRRYQANDWAVFPHFHFGDRNEEIDLVLFLNGMPLVAVELKHEGAGQTYQHAVDQYLRRNHSHPIFQWPFLFLASDTTNVKASTNPRVADQFRWLNAELPNRSDTPGEYPVEHLYRDVLSPIQLAEAIDGFLIGVPGATPYTVFPRYHQSRMVRKIAGLTSAHFAQQGHIGQKFLVHHSAGSGKTLSMCWLADRLHSQYDQATGAKLTDTVFLLTDRRSLDKNIRDELEHFEHLKPIVGIAKKAEDLNRFLKKNTPIIVTTQQKFTYILEKLQKDAKLKHRRVVFLIDEAHRSQDSKQAAAVRKPFQAGLPDEPDDNDDPEDAIDEAIARHDRNQLFVAFTATPSRNTRALFGDSIDTYTEAQAIAEGYILDVSQSILSYKTLYHIGWRGIPENRLAEFPKGTLARVLQTMAFQDMEILQYKAEEMLTLFEAKVKGELGGNAKAMIVATSRIAGLRYFRILQEKLKERGADYQVLYAFSDFLYQDPATGKTDSITETAVNGLGNGEMIEDRFAQSGYRLMVVANKFQTGFDQPLLTGMFLDKVVVDRNAVQTVSRLNRFYPGKKNLLVVDFTNNAKNIHEAFQKYRGENPHPVQEPISTDCTDLYDQILATGFLNAEDIAKVLEIRIPRGNALLQALAVELRERLRRIYPEIADQRAFVALVERFLKSFYFLTGFFHFPKPITDAVTCFEDIAHQLVEVSGDSQLLALLKNLYVEKASVQHLGEVPNQPRGRKHGGGGPGGPGGEPPKATLDEQMDDLRERYAITEAEALLIREVTEEKQADSQLADEVFRNRQSPLHLMGPLKSRVNGEMQSAYEQRDHIEEITDPRYIGPGGIFDIMAVVVIDHHLVLAGA